MNYSYKRGQSDNAQGAASKPPRTASYGLRYTKANSFYDSGTSYLFVLRYIFGLLTWVKGVNEVFYTIHTLSLPSYQGSLTRL